MIGNNLEIYTFDYLMGEALSEVDDSTDKRQGSIIYDSLAPACQRLAGFYMELRNFYRGVFIGTAEDEYLDHRVAEQGLTRYAATYARKRIDLEDTSGNPMFVALNSRFATESDIQAIYYRLISPYSVEGVVIPGAYIGECEEPGTAGNGYTGSLLNITNIQGLGSATMSTLIIPARDQETNKELRDRYLTALSSKPFGGNVVDYITKLKNMAGVGDVQVYPVWDGGGTVKCSILDASYNRCTLDFIGVVQDEIDPQATSGSGLGLAPIGHIVTITTPDNVSISISATIALSAGFSLLQVSAEIEAAIEEYFLSLRKSWAEGSSVHGYSLAVYISKVTAAILNVPGIANVTNVLINSVADDLELTQTSVVQQIPVLEEVLLNE